jgi:hypothetical protein
VKKSILIAGLICLTALIAGNAWALTLDFSNLTGAYIRFDGNTDTYGFTNNSTGYSFGITGSNLADSGLVGKIEGSFGIGAVTGIPGYQSAPVTGTGVLSIWDGAEFLTANISWHDGTTIGQSVVGGLLNIEGTVNLTGISYIGSNADLMSIKSAGEGIVTAAFTFNPGRTLEQLIEDGASNQTSYSGTLSAVPLPGALILLGVGLVRLVAYSRRKRALA